MEEIFLQVKAKVSVQLTKIEAKDVLENELKAMNIAINTFKTNLINKTSQEFHEIIKNEFEKKENDFRIKMREIEEEINDSFIK